MGLLSWLFDSDEEKLEKLRAELKVVMKELDKALGKDWQDLMKKKNELLTKINRLERKLGLGVYSR